MKTLSDFFHMGGYAFYVWTSYGLTAAVLIGNYLSAKRNQKQIMQQITRRATRAAGSSQ